MEVDSAVSGGVKINNLCRLKKEIDTLNQKYKEAKAEILNHFSGEIGEASKFKLETKFFNLNLVKNKSYSISVEDENLFNSIMSELYQHEPDLIANLVKWERKIDGRVYNSLSEYSKGKLSPFVIIKEGEFNFKIGEK